MSGLLERALEVSEQLGAQPLLAVIDGVLGRSGARVSAGDDALVSPNAGLEINVTMRRRP
jgi:hypothetical protein